MNSARLGGASHHCDSVSPNPSCAVLRAFTLARLQRAARKIADGEVSAWSWWWCQALGLRCAAILPVAPEDAGVQAVVRRALRRDLLALGLPPVERLVGRSSTPSAAKTSPPRLWTRALSLWFLNVKPAVTDREIDRSRLPLSTGQRRRQQHRQTWKQGSNCRYAERLT